MNKMNDVLLSVKSILYFQFNQTDLMETERTIALKNKQNLVK